MEREKLIAYIKGNDRKYKYDGVNFKYYSDEELVLLKKKIDQENKKEDEHKTPLESPNKK